MAKKAKKLPRRQSPSEQRRIVRKILVDNDRRINQKDVQDFRRIARNRKLQDAIEEDEDF